MNAPVPAVSDALVLNVDDTEPIRYAKTRALRRAGYRVIEASTGEEALRLAAAEFPALVLLDVNLPDMNGIQVCQAIKRDQPGMMVLQISATFVSSSDRVKGLEGGADSYLTQPVSSEELVAAVAALLRLHQAESALRQLNDGLEQRIAERTEALRAEIAEREKVEAALRQSQKLEALGHLTGGIAHDFNNLLMAILGNLDMMDRRLAQGRSDVRPMAANAIEAATRAAALTRRLLAFARQQPFRLKPVAVAPLLSGLEPMLKATLGESITLALQVEDEVWPVMCDGAQLENAVLNLVINARDAMPDGGRISVSARNLSLEASAAAALALDQAGDYVRIAVADTGEGMSPEVQAKAFDPFFTTKPLGRGTGLGLSMLYSFVRQAGGAVELTSAVGEGTEVAVLLRRNTRGEEGEAGDGDEAAPARGAGETVLVVEDETLVRDLICQALGEHGFACIEAATADEALALVGRGVDFDILLTDIGLPGLIDGRQLAVRIRERRPNVRLVLISGHGGGGPGQPEPESAEIDAYLPKPFEIRELMAVLQAALARRAAGT